MNSARAFRTAAAGSAAFLCALTLWASAPGYASQVRAHAGQARSAGEASTTATAAQASAKARTYKYSQSKVTFGGSRIQIAATDSHGDLYEFWQASGSKKWHKDLVAGATRLVSYGSPAIVWTKHALVIAAVNSKGSLETFTEKAGASRWVPEVVLTGNTYQSPAMTVAANGALLISVSDKQGGLYVVEYPTGPYGSVIGNEVAAGIFGASSIVTCEEPGDSGELALITATEAGTVYFWWQHLGVSPWDAETIASAGAPATWSGASVAASTTDVIVTAATTIGSIYAWTQTIGDTGWTESTVSALGRGTYSRPQIAWTGAVSGGAFTSDVITAVNQSGKLSYWWSYDGDGQWHAEKIAGNSRKAAYSRPAISVTGKNVVVTAINTKSGDLEYWYQKFLTNPWHNQLVAKG
jgi:hypothetical protein